METRVFLQPLRHLGVLVGGVIVTDQMQGFVLWRFPVDLAQFPKKLMLKSVTPLYTSFPIFNQSVI
jgi:hypothetical protein